MIFMKKKLLITIICVFFIIALIWYINSNVGNKSKYDVSSNLVIMEVKEGSLTNTKATLIMTNHTNDNYTYGNPYFIEKEKDGTWYELKTINDLFFTMPAFELKANSSVEFEIDWEYGYGKLESGKYRIIKDVSNSKGERIYIAAEFTIE